MPEILNNYLRVTKPGIICGNLITAAGGFFLAAKGQIDFTVLLPAVIGISLVVASGCVFNNWVDKNLDRKMARTCNRVLAQGLISPKIAVCYASLLGIAGTGLIWAATNMLSVAIVMTGFAVYVGVYSLYLKRQSIYATLIGGLAGAAPPLAGYCAVSNCFDMGALILLAIFCLWQIPHSYAIAIFRWDDYAAAAIPVLPVKKGTPAAKKHMVSCILAFTAAALMLTLCGYAGCSYFLVASALGLSWLYLACSGKKSVDDRRWAKKLFVFSILTIFVLSVMMAVDSMVPPTSNSLPSYVPKSNVPQVTAYPSRACILRFTDLVLPFFPPAAAPAHRTAADSFCRAATFSGENTNLPCSTRFMTNSTARVRTTMGRAGTLLITTPLAEFSSFEGEGIHEHRSGGS